MEKFSPKRPTELMTSDGSHGGLGSGQDVGQLQMPDERIVASAILERFGRIPEFAEWRRDKFRFTEYDIQSGWFTIESPQTGPINYALSPFGSSPDRNMVIRRQVRYNKEDPNRLAKVSVGYWAENVQYNYDISYIDQEAAQCSIHIDYADEIHKPNVFDTERIGHVSVLRRDSGDQIVHAYLTENFAEDVVRKNSSSPNLIGIELEGDPVVATLRMRGVSEVLPFGRIRKVLGHTQFARLKDDEGMVQWTRYDQRRKAKESLWVPQPVLVDIGELGRTAAAQDNRGWVYTNMSFPVQFEMKG